LSVTYPCKDALWQNGFYFWFWLWH
jgi:hypothetical protein